MGTQTESSRRQVYPSSSSNNNKKIAMGKQSFQSVDEDDEEDDDELSCCGSSVESLVMGLFVSLMIIFTIVIIFGDRFFLPSDTLEWCQAAADPTVEWKTYANRDAIRDPCYYERTPYLLGWSIFECDFGRRMLTSVILGAAIGWERRAADRPAGIRTMSLVCLGAATFTMGGQFTFRSSTMGWDAARVSAAIPSGVGFLGSALIWKETTGHGQDQRNHVHGITTAASIWISAAVGIGVGGALYVMSIYTVLLVAFVLRLGPLLVFSEIQDDEDDDAADTEAESEYEDFSDVDLDDDKDDDSKKQHQRDEELLVARLVEEQQHQKQTTKMERHKSLPAITRGIPRQMSMKKRMQLIKLESIKIQKKQHPTLKSD